MHSKAWEALGRHPWTECCIHIGTPNVQTKAAYLFLKVRKINHHDKTLSIYPAPCHTTYLMIYVLTTRPFVPEASILFPYHRALAQAWMLFTPTPLSPSHCLTSLHSRSKTQLRAKWLEKVILWAPLLSTLLPPLRLGSGSSSGLTNLLHSTLHCHYFPFPPAMTAPWKQEPCLM